MINVVLNSYSLKIQLVKRFVDDLSAGQMVTQPAGLLNHPAWTLGHLTYSAQALGGEIGVRPWLPDTWREVFGTGSNPVAKVSVYPEKAVLIESLVNAQNRITEVIREVGESGLARPLPDERYRRALPTVGHALAHILIGHTALHAGQLSSWRKAMELPVVSELEDLILDL